VAEALRAFAEAVAPDLIVVSGDVTQRAGPPSSRRRRPSWRLPDCPRLVVPGNHDLPLFDLWSRLLCPAPRLPALFRR
jgi:3',5'-cyclic AMP phosphodiesterase CpdA